MRVSTQAVLPSYDFWEVGFPDWMPFRVKQKGSQVRVTSATKKKTKSRETATSSTQSRSSRLPKIDHHLPELGRRLGTERRRNEGVLP